MMLDTNMNNSADTAASRLSFDDFRTIVLEDYKLAVESRMVSLLGRKEVLTGKAKFGIFGDGKELAQIALAKVFCIGDWRSGNYRDHSLPLATLIISVYNFFSQFYANHNVLADISSACRQLVSHFSTSHADTLVNLLDHTQQINSVSDISTTGGKMARTVG